MREIKFRAWDMANIEIYNGSTDPKRMSYYGPNFEMDDDRDTLNFFTPDDKSGPLGDHESMERYILMQFTGLLDKKGKEIYESDLLEVSENYTHPDGRTIEKGVYKTAYLFDGFGLFRPEGWWELSDFGPEIAPNYGQIECEVIGNIYENPELLKKNNNS